MTDKPVNLDEHRGMAAQKDTEIRRDLREVEVDQAALRARQEKLDRVIAYMHPDNVAVRRTFAKAGFHLVRSEEDQLVLGEIEISATPVRV